MCGLKSFFSRLEPGQHQALARCWRYQFFPRGHTVCSANEVPHHFFIVLEGFAILEEARVHHAEQTPRTLVHGDNCSPTVQKGGAFGHVPLIFNLANYGYFATAGSSGCCLLLINRHDYNTILRRTVESRMNAALAIIKSNRVFGNWTTTALARLYFKFSCEKCDCWETIVCEDGEPTMCFVLLSGGCEVVVRRRIEVS